MTGRAPGPISPEQVHLQFGSDAASQVSPCPGRQPAAVARPRLRFGPFAEPRSFEVAASERGYTDALTGETVYTYHARIDSLEPDTGYGYEVVHDDAPPVAGTFRTGPRGPDRPVQVHQRRRSGHVRSRSDAG